MIPPVPEYLPNEWLEVPGGFFSPVGHIYRDAQGQRILSVTQVFQLLGLVNYDFVRQEVLDRKSEIGIAVHRAVELLTEGTLDWETVDNAAWNYVVGTEQWMDDMKFVPMSREQRGICTVNGSMRFGYQYDLLGTMVFKGQMRWVLIDLKTASQESVTWALQTAAYEIAARQVVGAEMDGGCVRVVLHLRPDGRVKPLYYDDPADHNTFLYMLYVAIWMQNHNCGLDAVRAA